MYMGRKIKYLTDEEKRISRNKAFMKYYEKNKEKVKIRNLKRYYENKLKI
jgi:hypothetical protein